MVAKKACSCCGVKAEVMALHKGRVLCFECLVNRYPALADLLASYLVNFKHIKPEPDWESHGLTLQGD
jgi:hypothetical protein